MKEERENRSREKKRAAKTRREGTANGKSTARRGGGGNVSV